MFSSIVNSAVKNRLLIVIFLLVTATIASVVVPKLNLDAFPDVTNVQVAINTEAPGLAAEEVEQLITFPIEAVMYALPDVEEVRSISKTGLSGITVVFTEGTDIYFARQLVFERLQAARELIPQGVGTPEMGPNTSGLGQVFQYLLVAQPGSDVTTMELRSLNDWVVKLLLMPVDGITDVLSFGGEVRQYQVNINPVRLLSYSLSQANVVDALEANNTNVGGWYMDRGQEQLVIRGTGWLSSDELGLEEIRQVPVANIGGVVVTVADLASVELGSEIRQGAVTMTSRDALGDKNVMGEVVSGIVLKRIGANTKSTIDSINDRLPLIQQALPEGVSIQPFYDQADLIKAAVNTVIEALTLAFVFIVVVLILFLMSLRATFLVLLSIPVSIAIALMIMSWYGLSANLMSLGGLAVAIGMLVDGSVVMVENIYKHLALESADRGKEKRSVSASVTEAAKEVARPIFFATAIILVVFMPMFTFEGVEAKLFEPMAISIILALISAVFVALIVVPALATYVFARGFDNRSSFIVKPMEKAYRVLLRHALNNRWIVLVSVAMLVMGAASLLPKIGTEFAPELEEGTINVRVTLAPSANLDTALSVSGKLENLLLDFPEVNYALSRIGRAEIGGDPEPVNNIEIYIGLRPVKEWTSANNREQLQARMAEKLAVHPGLLFNFSQPIATRVDELLSGVKAELAIKLSGPSLAVLASKGQEIEQVVSEVKGTQDVALEQIQGEAQLVITPNRRQLSRYGIAVADLMALIRDGLGGQSAGQIIKGNERYDIYVRLDEKYRRTSTDIQDLRLQSPSGAWVRVGDIANVDIVSGPPQIRRDDVQRRVVVQANVQGRDMGSVVDEIQAQISKNVELPAGYSTAIGGQYENQLRAQNKLLVVVPLSLALIALLLYFAFQSVGQALLILLNVPLATIGGILALYITGQYLSVPSSVGFITLFGLAVLNGVVMVESINRQVYSTAEWSVAIFEGATSRLRPVIMTATTSALGLIPIVLSSGVGAEIQRPLASVILGGLITSTLLTLIVLPVLYETFSKKKILS
jgi:cobalt-zinc-cadmium resistance protein CzcA